MAYNGLPYVGWQIQNNGESVQSVLEDRLSTMLRQSIRVVGCGRTDSGVHARSYFAHVEADAELEPYVSRLNRMLPGSIVVYEIFAVSEQMHARFSALERTYRYYITKSKDPFKTGMTYLFHAIGEIDMNKLEAAAELVTKFEDFAPFCKTRSGVEHYKCQIFESFWQEQEKQLVYTITANRFLRGMVRLIVGMCLQVSIGRLDLAVVREALEQQSTLEKSWAVPPQGLYLEKVTYRDLT